jgi:hypothetical protein
MSCMCACVRVCVCACVRVCVCVCVCVVVLSLDGRRSKYKDATQTKFRENYRLKEDVRIMSERATELVLFSLLSASFFFLRRPFSFSSSVFLTSPFFLSLLFVALWRAATDVLRHVHDLFCLPFFLSLLFAALWRAATDVLRHDSYRDRGDAAEKLVRSLKRTLEAEREQAHE